MVVEFVEMDGGDCRVLRVMMEDRKNTEEVEEGGARDRHGSLREHDFQWAWK